MIYVDGVVCRLMQLMQYAHVSSALRRCRKYCQTELILVHSLRATECKHNAARLNLAKGDGVKTRIPLQRTWQSVLVLGKGRGVKHNEVVVAASLLQEFEGIFGKSLMTCITRNG